MSKEEISIEELMKKVKAGQRLTHEEIGFWLSWKKLCVGELREKVADHEERLQRLESKEVTEP